MSQIGFFFTGGANNEIVSEVLVCKSSIYIWLLILSLFKTFF